MLFSCNFLHYLLCFNVIAHVYGETCPEGVTNTFSVGTNCVLPFVFCYLVSGMHFKGQVVLVTETALPFVNRLFSPLQIFTCVLWVTLFRRWHTAPCTLRWSVSPPVQHGGCVCILSLKMSSVWWSSCNWCKCATIFLKLCIVIKSSVIPPAWRRLLCRTHSPRRTIKRHLNEKKTLFTFIEWTAAH